MKRAVVFDLDGVLGLGWHNLPEKRKPWSATIVQDLGIEPEALKRFFLDGTFESEVLTGKRTLEDLLREVLPDCGYDGDISVFIDYWMAHDSKMDERLLDVIQKLRASGQVRLFLATNNEHTRIHHLWETVGLKNFFDEVFFAAELKVLKPDLAFFKACEARMGDTGDQPPLFFDDTPSYVEGARACGWEAVVYNDINDCLSHPFIKGLLCQK